jgi:hypothetical protein
MLVSLEVFVERYPEQPAGHPNLAGAYCELSRADDARRELELTGLLRWIQTLDRAS